MSLILPYFDSKIILIGSILIGGYIGNYLIKWTFNRILKSSSIHIKFLKHSIQGILVVTIVMLMSNCFEATKNLTSVILASSGLLVAVLGFAAQESLSNIINGFFISVFKPFERLEKLY